MESREFTQFALSLAPHLSPEQIQTLDLLFDELHALREEREPKWVVEERKALRESSFYEDEDWRELVKAERHHYTYWVVGQSVPTRVFFAEGDHGGTEYGSREKAEQMMEYFKGHGSKTWPKEESHGKK